MTKKHQDVLTEADTELLEAEPEEAEAEVGTTEHRDSEIAEAARLDHERLVHNIAARMRHFRMLYRGGLTKMAEDEAEGILLTHELLTDEELVELGV